ncbi:MAG: alpha/beta fold hydrolase [Anaerolineales bacterium]|jgi:pimeloyl-ACP methyl ester carboxylesterase
MDVMELVRKHLLKSSIALLVLAGCSAAPTSVPTPTLVQPTQSPLNFRSWIEEEVSFTFGQDQLFGILTLPSSEGPYPAIVIVSGARSTGAEGVSSTYYIEHARKMASLGYAVLRYDPPGVGQSSGERGFQSLDNRTEEAIAALHYLQSRSDIQWNRVGLWGISQGGWVIAMAAAAYPQDVGFIISVSGSGVGVAEQQVHSIEAQSKAAQMPEQDVTKAVLFGRLLIDWQLSIPQYRDLNEAEAQALGEGPWTDFVALVYEPGTITPAVGLQKGIEILRSIQDESWAEFLYLREVYLPRLESIPPEQVEVLKATTGQTLLNDPQEYWSNVQCPVLAIFGADDLLQPTARSADLYEQYLTEAGNGNFNIVVIPDVGHYITLSTPGYWEVLSNWLNQLYEG